jgi:hypothetical protein
MEEATLPSLIFLFGLAPLVASGNPERSVESVPPAAEVQSNPVQTSGWGVDLGPLFVLPPAVGFRIGGDNPRYSFAIPWSIQFGPGLKGEAGEGLRPNRAVVELGLIQSQGGGRSYYLRPGLRRFWQSTGIWGFGLGLGFTNSLSKNMNSGVSQEILLSLGRCCSPGFLIVSVRYEYLLSGNGEVWTSLGVAAW